ncbi:heterokaryon incompatibility protein-domain-containing protein [Hypoxylon argillaceum]|nr:heterokaryon incompatibility protein-domain-containing protein [Hypoxylon argillaceum]
MKFVYTPLIEDDGIRVLLLEPAVSREENLRGSLQQVSLAQLYDEIIEPYTALSYVWGNPTQVDKILLSNHELGITANLSNALRDLRDTSKTHRLWVDAACIDQENVLERSNQVSLMGKIYSYANNTAIYLEFMNPYIDAVIELAKQYAHSDSPEDIAANPPILCGDSLSTRDETLLIDAVYQSLLPCPWFRRIWVLQELVLSREPWVQCGRKRVRWVDLCRLLAPRLERRRRDEKSQSHLKTEQLTTLESMNDLRIDYWGFGRPPLFDDHPHTPDETLYGVEDLYSNSLLSDRELSAKIIRLKRDVYEAREFAEIGKYRRRLWRILQSRKSCQVSDPRDMIFAHMGIISDRHEAEKFIKIDYSQTTSEVLAAAGRYICFKANLQTMLAGVTRSPFRTMVALPSWVPDWGVNVGYQCLPQEKGITPNMHFIILRAAKIIHLSDVLPTPSSLKRDLKAKGHDLTWREIADVLTTTNDSTQYGATLSLWPYEMVKVDKPTKEKHNRQVKEKGLLLRVAVINLHHGVLQPRRKHNLASWAARNAQ